MKKFEEEYKRLNAAQRQAVDTIEGPVLVIAGPGTGKTQLLSMRVANILKQTDTDASSILCLTFTNKAALNMRERLQVLAGPDARKVNVRTFHSFAAEIMNQYPDYFWNGARLSVAPDAVQEDIIQTILAELPQDDPLASVFAGSFTALPGVKEGLKLAKEAGLKPQELRGIINDNIKYLNSVEPAVTEILSPPLSIKNLQTLLENITRLQPQKIQDGRFLLPLSTVLKESLAFAIQQDIPTNKTTETGKWKRRWLQTVGGNRGMFDERKRNQWWLSIANVYEKYRELLHNRGYYDYSDMLVEVLEQLQANPDLLADVQERYLYVLIDEFQDTNAAQLRLSHLIADHYAANNRPNIMAVGDDDQSIFAFNGAELNNMLNFQRNYPDTLTIVLTDNYRSAQPVLDAAAQIIELAEDRLVKRDSSLTKVLRANRTPDGKVAVTHTSYPTRSHQQVAVAKKIQALWKNGERDIAVLARKHESLRQLASILHQYDVPLSYEQQSNVLEHEAVKQVCHIAQVVIAISDGDRNKVNVGLSKLLRHPMWGIDAKQLWKLALDNYSTPDYLDSLLSAHETSLSNIGNWLVWLSRTSQDQPLPLSLEYILGMSEGQYLRSPFREHYLSKRPLASEYIETISAVQLLRQLALEFASKSEASLADFVHFIEINLSNRRVIANETWFASSNQAVELLTVYKAKGLEFDHVFLVDGVETMWSPRTGGRKSPANLQLQSYGEKDDDYVRLLYVAATRAKRIFSAHSFSHDEKGSELLPTALLASLPLEVVLQPIEEPLQVIEDTLRWPKLSTSNEHAMLRNRLDNFELSPTSLIDFLNLAEAGPASFKERHLLRLPHPRSMEGSYGTAIHAALETAQRLVNSDLFNLGTILDRFETALESEYMPPREFEQLKARGKTLLMRLFDHADLLVPKGALSEQNVQGVVVGKARLKGKLDSILVSDNSLRISDYKTGKPLTSFATKDKNKMIKAWRHRTQLLFYCLLLQESGRFKSTDISAQMLYVEAESSAQLSLCLIPTSEEIERLTKLISAVWHHIQDLNFPDTTGYSPDIEGVLHFEDDLVAGKL